MKIMYKDVDRASLSVVRKQALDKDDHIFYAHRQHRVCLGRWANWSIWIATNGLILTFLTHYGFALMVILALLPFGLGYLRWRKRVLFVTQSGLWLNSWKQCAKLTDNTSPSAIIDAFFDLAGIHVGYLAVEGEIVTPMLPDPIILAKRLKEADLHNQRQETGLWRF